MFIRWFLLTVTYISIVVCEETTEDDIQINIHRPRQLPSYEYNHPPFFESYDSDDLNVLESKLILSRSPRDLNNNTKIPVAIVYENTKPEVKTTVNKVRRRKQRRQQGANKKQNTESILNSTKRNEPLREIITTTTAKPTLAPILRITEQPNRDVTTFPKRPAEDSRRIELQRRSRIQPPVVKILEEKNFVYAHNGNFHYSYDSADGTKISSRGELLRNDKNEGTGEAVVGNVSYKDDEGHDVNLSYTADENGYRPVGAHLPTPPPIPPAIARALKYLATKNPETTTEKIEKSLNKTT